MLEAAIEAGASDVSSDEAGHVVTTAFADLGEVARALEERLGEPESVRSVWRPQSGTPVDAEKAATLMKLIGALEDDDDVQNVYANYDLDETVLARLSAA